MVYIISYVIEDGFNIYLFFVFGCSVNDVIYCGVKLLINNIMNFKKYDFFELVVNECNGWIECILGKYYFIKVELFVKMLCDVLRIFELEKVFFW